MVLQVFDSLDYVVIFSGTILTPYLKWRAISDFFRTTCGEHLIKKYIIFGNFLMKICRLVIVDL